jgi:pyruvate,water dikinase
MIDYLNRYFKRKREDREREALAELKARYHAFRIFLENNGRALELIVNVDGLLSHDRESELRPPTEELLSVTGELVDGLNLLSGHSHGGLYPLHGNLSRRVINYLERLEQSPVAAPQFCAPLDHPHAADPAHFGRKAATLARLRQMSLPVPDGFVCSTASSTHFLSATGLETTIRNSIRHPGSKQEDQERAAAQIREMVLSAPLPLKIRAALEDGYAQLNRRAGNNPDPDAPLPISVRSSGVSEDGAEFSFAGQYTSILNVQGLEDLCSAYREVIASAFSIRAMSYRHNAGLSPLDFDLAVLCQLMVDADCAGVLFTHDPARPDSGRMMISAVPGLGTTAVDGSEPADLYYPPRIETVCIPDIGTTELPPVNPREKSDHLAHIMEGAKISIKKMREVPARGGGLRREALREELADQPLLSLESLDELTRLGSMIESLERGPQDIEWAWSENQGVFILQARPLRLPGASEGKRIRMPPVSAPLVSGSCGSAGRAIGKACIIHSAAELRQWGSLIGRNILSDPSILVLPQSIVDAAYLLKSCSGAIIDVGNPTDHLSCVAREYGIPMITGAETALACLRNGQWIVLDADNGLVINAPESLIASAVKAHRASSAKNNETAPQQATAPLSKGQVVTSLEKKTFRELIVPLNLTDASGPSFSAGECSSVHDVIRYTHEMAILSMFSAGDMVMEDAGSLLHPLEIGVPFQFLVIDVGGGVRLRKKSLLQRLSPRDPLHLDDILSTPLLALCRGLTTPGLSWHSSPDADALPGIMSRTMLDARGRRPAGSFNYALAARDYINLNARVEYHFAMLDAVCGRDSHANYIRFRFKGGGAGGERSRRRARFLQHVLEENTFFTSVVGDLVTASLTGASKEVIFQRLIMLGQLFGFSRFLDGVMSDDEIPLQLARQFLNGNFSTRNVPGAGETDGRVQA